MSKKFKKFVLHIGGDKTGSTAIQKSLSYNKDKLLTASGLIYPLEGWHAELGSYFSDNPEKYVFNRGLGITDLELIKKRDENYFGRFQSDLKLASEADTIVVSYEGFISASSDILFGLKNYALQIADELLIVVYLRPPISYALSAMSQHVKCGRRPYPSGAAPYIPYAKFLKHIVKVFGKDKVYARKFDRKNLINESVVDDFLNICGVSADVYENLNAVQDSANNASLSYEGLMFGDEVIKEMENRNMGANYSTFEFQRKIGQFFSKIPGKKFRISEIDSDNLTSRFNSDLRYIKSKFGLDLSEKYSTQNDDSVYNPDEDKSTVYPYANVLVDIMEQALLLEYVDMLAEADKKEIDAALGEKITFQVSVFNNSTLNIHTKSRYPVKASCFVNELGDEDNLAKGNRIDIPHSIINRKSQVKFDVTLTAPLKPGKYKITTTLVQEHHAWLHKIGLKPAIVNLSVS